MYEFYIYNQAKERIGILENWKSVQWLLEYQDVGEVKIVAARTDANLELLVPGNRVYSNDNPDPSQAALATIELIEITDNGASQSITARAFFPEKKLSHRVVMATVSITDYEAGMYALFEQNARGLDIVTSETRENPIATETELTWGAVLDGLIAWGKASGLGFRTRFDKNTTTETFEVYSGVDRSSDDSPNYVGYFGDDAENIADIRLKYGPNGLKNVAIVAGENPGDRPADRVVRTVSLADNLWGDNRLEMFVDAKNIQKTHSVATQTGFDERGNPTFSYQTRTYTDEEYDTLLDNKGLEELAKNVGTFDAKVEILQETILYGVDYTLGDRMPLRLDIYGLRMSARISSALFAYENNGGRTITVGLDDFNLEV